VNFKQTANSAEPACGLFRSLFLVFFVTNETSRAARCWRKVRPCMCHGTCSAQSCVLMYNW